VVLDALVGEPPAWAHPVVWIDWLLARLEAVAPAGEFMRLMYGAGVAVGVPFLSGWLAGLVGRRLPWVGQAVILKPAFAGRSLLEAGRLVERDVQFGRIGEARQALRALVSRPTGGLDAAQVSAAAIESLVENVVDSWLAPRALYALGGLPWAYAYRAANTADAMWGYHNPRYEHLGKAAARLDDAFNFMPARLAALIVVLLAPDPQRALRVWWIDSKRTQSPNAGQVMAAAAGGLGVRLEKPAHYVLNDSGATPTPRDIQRARHLVQRAMVAAAILCVLARR